MNTGILLALIAALAVAGYVAGRARSLVLGGGSARPLHSIPGYYGAYVALWCGVPALILIFAWTVLQGSVIDAMVLGAVDPARIAAMDDQQRALFMADIRNVATGNILREVTDPAVAAGAERYAGLRSLAVGAMWVVSLGIAMAGLIFARQRLSPQLRARNRVETAINVFMILCALMAVVTTVGIVFSLLFESLRFFAQVSPLEFFFGTEWSPQTALRADQVGSSGAFGAVPLFTGTLLIAGVALSVAVPIGLLSAIHMSEYAHKQARAVIKPLLEILAGIPTVVFGFFAILVVAPFIRDLGAVIGLGVSSQSALAAGLVMGVMIVPFVSSLSDDVINAVPQSLRDGAYALGATRSETVTGIILPAALPGIVGAVLLAASRAIGETMIVVMAAGLAANLSANPLDAVTTVTVQIATLLVGDQEFDSPKTLSAFALGLTLFVVTLILNVLALQIVRRYREKYD